MPSDTTVRPSPLHRGCVVCDTCGAHFNPDATGSVRYDLTSMGGGITPPLTRRPGVCLGCGRTWKRVTDDAE